METSRSCGDCPGTFLILPTPEDRAGDTKVEKNSDIISQETPTSASGPAANSPETLPFKSKLRPTQRKPTREETYELLRTTVIPVARFENTSIGEALVELNRLTSDAGIPPEQLKFIRGAPEISPDDFLERRLEDIAVKNILLAHLLKYLVGNRTIRYRVSESFVEFRNMHELTDHQDAVPSNPPEKAAPGVFDPFAPD